MRLTVLLVLLAVLMLVLPSSDAFFNRRRRKFKGKKGRNKNRQRGKGFVRGFDYVKKSIDSMEKSIHKPPYNRHTDYGHDHHHPPPHSYHQDSYHGPHHGHDHGYHPRERKFAHGPHHGPVIYHGDDHHHHRGGHSPGGGHYHWYPDNPSYSRAHHHHYDDNRYHDDDYGRSYGEDSHIEHMYGSIKKLRRRKKGKGDYFKVGNTHHPVATYKNVDESYKTNDDSYKTDDDSYKAIDDTLDNVDELGESIFPDIDSEIYESTDDLPEIRQYDTKEVKSRYSGTKPTIRVYRNRYPPRPVQKMSYPQTNYPRYSSGRRGHSDRQRYYRPAPYVKNNHNVDKGVEVSYYSNRDDEDMTTQSPKMNSEYTFLDEIFVEDDPFKRNFAVSSYTFYNMNDVGSTLLPETINIF